MNLDGFTMPKVGQTIEWTCRDAVEMVWGDGVIRTVKGGLIHPASMHVVSVEVLPEPEPEFFSQDNRSVVIDANGEVWMTTCVGTREWVALASSGMRFRYDRHMARPLTPLVIAGKVVEK
jgi:hypothetical protein